MKSTISALSLVIVLLFTSSCSTPQEEAPSPSPELQEAPVEESIPVQTEEIQSPEEIIISACSDYATSENITVVTSGRTTTVNLFEPDLAVELLKAKSDGISPSDWDNIRDGIVELSMDLPDISGLDSSTNIVMCLKDSKDGDIYLTVSGGEIMYDAFSESDSEPVVYNAPTISLAEYNQIKNGMTYDEVIAIVGSFGEVLSETDLGLGPEYATAMWSWDGEGSWGANANVMFQGGKVVSKAQIGLE